VSLLALCVGIAAVVVFVVVAYARPWPWTGFVAQQGDASPGTPVRAGKTLWDWLELLVVPLVLALGAFWLNDQQRQRDKRQEAVRAKQEAKVAADRRRDDALRDYLQRMSQFVLVRDRGDKETRLRALVLTRTFTLTVLGQLDGRRKGIVVQFLSEAGLIDRSAGATDVLDGANLREASLKRMVLDEMNFSGADLRDADLDGALLTRTVFRFANLRRATLREVFIDETDFREADLRSADLSKAGPAADKNALFSLACLSGTGFREANLIGANFAGAQGWKVDFTGAELDRAHLEDTQLGAVKLGGATTDNTHFPKGWRGNGIALSREGRRELCNHLDWWRRG
jgi:hypothetical protein